MNEKFGVRAHDLAEKKTPEELAEAVAAYGFSKVQLVFKKALSNPSFTEENALAVKKALDEHGISVAMLGAYFNPVHSNPQVVADGIATFKANLSLAHLWPNNPYVGSETGSYNDSPWIYHPKNQTEEGYQQTKKVFEELRDYAESIGARIAIESAWGHVIYSYQQQARLIEELHSENVYATVDLYNLLYEGNFAQRDEIFEGALKTLGDKVRIIHIKDAKIVDGKMVQVAPGEGEFHYDFMLSCVKKYCPNATMVFEGVRAEKMESASAVLTSSFETVF